MQSLTAESITPTIKNDDVDLRMADAGPMTASFIRLAAGTDLGPALVGLEGDACQCPHWGYMIEGTLTMRTADGEQDFHAGDAFYWGPGHVPVAKVDCAYVDFSPTAEFHAVIAHITGGGS